MCPFGAIDLGRHDIVGEYIPSLTCSPMEYIPPTPAVVVGPQASVAGPEVISNRDVRVGRFPLSYAPLPFRSRLDWSHRGVNILTCPPPDQEGVGLNPRFGSRLILPTTK
ncbi:hypothetical protein ElyMa_004026900 [Elysia marginata]|uniref:Uncharacterized protein n=1 Tax=Elysia marginata TaxID=1093978 RepID=A0AAV4G540_9GAST|nr:hypothetical protein ElyMa_004026900 [Elysia marginata]